METKLLTTGVNKTINKIEFTLSSENSKSLIKIIKKYINFFKILHFIDPVIATEFQKKQEYFLSKLHKDPKSQKKDESHSHNQSGGCCNHKINNKSI